METKVKITQMLALSHKKFKVAIISMLNNVNKCAYDE